ncbi:AraC family transcriptional regulator [Paucibacter sp. TC2R-5]|uniref:AraC family transcriptional regulator n=1 Tax=Paucibacter sp. TC2R-5 TaxID=2893555 RepID=UPI0021E47911|nr:AraC family transcriptional regulator [Paucibacter sp. TC2R-5]MCV2359309.1 AraC family transcriptional regulator [Paucibacter sp. TC2R-5]
MDRLSLLFDRMNLNARIFHSGALCGIASFSNDTGQCMLHVLNRGVVRVSNARAEESFEITQPSLLFYPASSPHRFEVNDASGADLVCAFIDFGPGMGKQILLGMPEKLLVPLAAMAGVESTLALLFDEAFAQRSGRAAGIERLVEFFTILLLRHTLDAGLVNSGLLAGLADERLTKALMAMQARPEHAWALEELAATAHMSRARFALHFHAIVGATPLDYLTDWRISVAQALLKRGKSLKMVAPAVGYTNPAAFARAFAKRVGSSPVQWMALEDE